MKPLVRLIAKQTYTRLPSRVQNHLRPPVSLIDQLKAAVKAGNETRIDLLINEFQRLRKDFEEALSPEIRRTNAPLEFGSGTQSKQFMIDLLPHIQEHIKSRPRRSTLDVLDVGPGSGHGTALLSSLYASTELGYRMRVTGLDIRPEHRRYFRMVAPYADYKIADIYQMYNVYDIVIASHVIEHVPTAGDFCRALQKLSRDVVFIVAPFNEPPEKRTKGHYNTINKKFIDGLNPLEVTVMNSAGWGASHIPPYEMVIAKLPGTAGPTA